MKEAWSSTAHLSVQVIELELTAVSPLGIGRQTGTSLRGALFDSMRSNLNVCLYKHLSSCIPCTLRQVCPLSGLLATVDDEAARGHDVPRPMAIQPPLDEAQTYDAGDAIRFRVILFGSGARYVPYLILAARELERSGLGLRVGAPRRFPPERGMVRLGTVAAINPFTGERAVLRAPDDDTIYPANLTVTSDDVERYATSLPDDEISLQLLTPVRLIEDGRLVRPLRFDALIWRLAERLEALTRYYASRPWTADIRALVERARGVAVHADETRWVDREAHSSRTGRWSPTGGYVGQISFRGDLAPFRSVLAWGTLIHVGKSATRGNGWFTILSAARGSG